MSDRLDLFVPFEEKDEARGLGARWDARARCWFVPAGVDRALFSRWFEPRPETVPAKPEVGSIELSTELQTPQIVEADVWCHDCGAQTPVLTVADFDQDGDLDGVTRIQAMDATLTQALKPYPYYRMTYSRTARLWAFANVCSHCEALQGEFFLHNEPDGPFFAMHHERPEWRVTTLDYPTRVAIAD